MGQHFLVRRVVACAAAILSLVILGVFLFPVGQAGSTPNPAQSQPSAEAEPAPPPLDLRWLSRVRTEAVHEPLSGQAGGPLSIYLHLTDRYVVGHAPLASTVVVSITRADMQAGYAAVKPFPDMDSFLYVAYPLGSVSGGYTPPVAFQPGDVVWVTQAGATVSMTVPALSALADSADDMVYGTAPASQAVTAYLFPFDAPDTVFTRTTTSGGDGQYQVAWSPALDVHTRDTGYVAWAQDASRQAHVRFVAPFLQVGLNGRGVYGMAAPNSTVTITATDAAGAPWLTLYANANADGSFQGEYYYWYKSSARPWRAGDHVIATAGGQTFSTTVAAVTAHADITNGVVWGESPANASVQVRRFPGPLSSDVDYAWQRTAADQVVVTASATGHYSAALALAPADYGAALVTGGDGHQTYARFAVPQVRVYLGDSTVSQQGGGPPPPGYGWLVGQVDDPAAPITITLQGPSGYLKDMRFATAGENGYFYDAGDAQTIGADSGDVITLTTPRGIQAALTLPRLTAQVFLVSDTVTGQTPPGAVVQVSVSSWPPKLFPPPFSVQSESGGDYGSYTLVVTATEQGEYVADFSSVVDLAAYVTGEVRLTLPGGHIVVRTFRGGAGCQATLNYAQVGGNHIGGMLYNCYSAMLRLRDSAGQVKSTHGVGGGYGTWVYYALLMDTASGQPVMLSPGDTIEIEAQSSYPTPTPTPSPTPYTPRVQAQTATTTTWQVPLLTAALDAQADTVSGQAPPSTDLSLAIYRAGASSSWLTTTASAQGAYSVSLAGRYDLQAGDRVRVQYLTGQPMFYAEGVLPALDVELYGARVSGVLPPLAQYTASLQTSRPVTAQVHGYAGTSGDLNVSLAALWPGDTVVVTTTQQVLRLSLPALTAWANCATGTVYGQAPPSSRLRVDLNYETVEWQQLAGTQTVTATASGVYTAAFPDLAPMPNMVGTLYYWDEQGNTVRLGFSVPYWDVTLDSMCINANAGVINAPVTVTLETAEGAFKSAQGSVTNVIGNVWPCFTETVQPTDRLTLVHAGGVMTFTVPALMAEHDFGRQVVEGQGIANGSVLVNFSTPPGYYSSIIASRRTLADASGHFGLDTSGLGLRPRYTGQAIVTDEAGNIVRKNFDIRGLLTFLPVVRRE